ncbi:uncharacterized protein LOC135345789 isoform X2 [Halichondria panicea]|uniref:uncharacterized protein LOC135345789 isoform X2 n=1 Tax=Halichondria panicea TaxID=6063 RepID=UPI00312BC6B1
MDLPEDLSCLKRPALQALCKRHGIKANGKNTDMIKTLERIRSETVEAQTVKAQTVEAQTNSDADDQPGPSPVVEESGDSPFAVATKIVRKKKAGRKGMKRKTRSGSNKERKSESSADSSAASDLSELASEDPILKPTDSTGMGDTPCDNKPTSRKRKRRNTHSVSPNSSFCSLPKIPRLGPTNDDFTSWGSPPNTPMQTGDSDSNSGDKNTSDYVDKEDNIVTRPPISPPTENSGSRKRKRNSTFVVSPSPSKMETGAPEEKSESGYDVMAELQNILDKKVQERKHAPDYKPVHSVGKLFSRLPVKTNTERKFDKAHSSHFKKMKSIVSVVEDKKRKQSTGRVPSCAKKPRLSSSVVRAPLHTNPSTHKSPARRRVTSSINSEVFKPTNTTTKKMNVKFSELSKSTNNPTVQCCSPHPGFQLKTPKKVLVVKKTPSKKSYNLEESLRKKPAYKPYTGPVPKFGTAQH